jgi:hypothetical protein
MIRVKAAFFSMTAQPPPDDDGSYLRWHLLDHMPEQYQLPGVVHAMRWIADGDYPNHRLVAEGPLADLGGVVNYLIGDPVQQTFDDFMDLGPRLAEMGRFPERRPSLGLSLLALQRWYAAPRVLVSGEVVPFRPHRGVLVVVEEPAGADAAGWLQWLHRKHFPELLEVPGVAGAWVYGSTNVWKLHPNLQSEPQFITVIYLDDNPLTTASALRPVIEQRWLSGAVRPRFAGPLRTMIEWEAWR